MTTPLSMIIIGRIISEMKIKEIIKEKNIYSNSIIRLLIIPLLVFFILKIFIISNIVLGVCVLLAAMPVAVTTPIFAEKYNGDINLSSKAVVISTLLSVVTIPLLIIILL